MSIFKIDTLNHSAIHLINIRVAGFEPTIFYSQSKYVNLFFTLYSKLQKLYYVNKIKKAIIKANKATASVKANPKIV